MIENEGSDHNRSSVLFEFDQNADLLWNQVRIRFRVGEMDLLVGQTRDGVSVPGIPLLIPHFATFGMACLRVCKQVGRAALELDDYAHELLFQTKGEDVLICSTMLRTTIRVNFEELFEAWQSFAKHVQRIVISKYPDSATKHYWRLIEHYPHATLEEELTRQAWFDERED